MTPTDLITLEEAALALRVDPRSVRRWVAQGRIRAWKVGGRLVRLSAEDVAELLVPIPSASDR